MAEDLGITALRLKPDERIALLVGYIKPIGRARYPTTRHERLTRARRLGTHSNEQWTAIVAEFGGRCVWCCRKPRKIAKDHVVPIYLGGSDGADNLQPLCPRCNTVKAWDSIDWASYRRAHGFPTLQRSH